MFSDRDSYFLNSKRAPFIFSGFHFIILKDEFVLPVEPECDDQEQLNRSILKAFGQLLGMSWQNVSSVIHALEDEAGVFFPRIRICETKIKQNHRQEHQIGFRSEISLRARNSSW